MNTKMHGGKTVAGNTQNGRLRRGSLWKGPAWITALILLIPLLGNHFVDGWNWALGGFVVAGMFLFGTSLTYELVTRKADTIAHRVAVGIALAAAFLLVWVNFVQAADDVNPAAVCISLCPSWGSSLPPWRASSHMAWHARYSLQRSLKR